MSPDYPRAFKCARCTASKRIAWLIARSPEEEAQIKREHQAKYHDELQPTQAMGLA